MTNEYEQPLNIGWDTIWTIWYSMNCSWMPEFIRKLKNKSPMEKLREHYGIPEIYADNRQEYLKYRIDRKYYDLVNNHFNSFFTAHWFSFPWREYWKEQDKYNETNPTWWAGLDFAIPYEQFLEDNMKKNWLKEQKIETQEVSQNKLMTEFMKTVTEQIKELKQLHSLNPNTIQNDTTNTNTTEVDNGKVAWSSNELVK